MRVIDVEAGESNVYVRLRSKDKQEKMYELQSSKRKNSAQLVKAKKAK